MASQFSGCPKKWFSNDCIERHTFLIEGVCLHVIAVGHFLISLNNPPLGAKGTESLDNGL